MSDPIGFDEFFFNFNKEYSFINNLEITLKHVKNIIWTDLNQIYDLLPSKETVFYSFSEIAVSLKNRKKPGTLGIMIELKLEPFQNIYKRSYTKLEEALATILSVHSFVSFLCQILVHIFEYGGVDHYFIK
jgi:hypothetical protein